MAYSLYTYWSQMLKGEPLIHHIKTGFLRVKNRETIQQFNARLVDHFERTDLDGWEFRQIVNEAHGLDLVLDPTIINAALHASRRLNDISLAIRLLEAVKYKCAPFPKNWDYVVQEIRPTMNDLGLQLPEEMGMDKPEYYFPDPNDS